MNDIHYCRVYDVLWPTWARFLAFDDDEEAAFYEAKPTLSHDGLWESVGKCKPAQNSVDFQVETRCEYPRGVIYARH